MRRVKQETEIVPFNRHKQSDFIRHYLQKYDRPPEPPSWMVFELLPFGSVSMVFAKLLDAEKKAIAADFGLPRDRLQSWLHATSHLRNLCAHHSRVWNRKFGVTPSVAKSEQHHIIKPKLFYNHAVAIQTLLKKISGDTHRADRLKALLTDYPNIPIQLMGFPANWTAGERSGDSRLARRDGEVLFVHRLGQAVTRNRLPAEEHVSWAKRAASLSWMPCFPTFLMVPLTPGLRLSTTACSRMRWRRLEHAEGHGVALGGGGLAIDEKAFGPDHPSVATASTTWAWCSRTSATSTAPARRSSGR